MFLDDDRDVEVSKLKNSLKFSSPPSRQPRQEPTTCGEDVAEIAREKDSDRDFGRMLGAAAALALTLAPSAVQAEPKDQAIEQPLERDDDTSLGDSFKAMGEKFKSFMEDLEETRESDIGEYKLRYKPMDVELKPKWNDGEPGLRLKGDFYETSLVLKEDVGEDWTSRQGLRGILRGEVSTYDDSKLDLHLGAFKTWNGPVSKDFDANLDTQLGFVKRAVGDHAGMALSLSLRQQVEGEWFQFRGEPYDLEAEARQTVSYNLETEDTVASYSARVALKRDFKFKVFGRKAKLSISAGPQVRGSSNSDAKSEFKTKARIKF